MMDQNSSDFLVQEREMLLQDEIRKLSKRVDALIDCAEKIDESQQQKNNLDYNENKDKSSSSEEGVTLENLPSADTFDKAWVKVSDDDENVRSKSANSEKINNSTTEGLDLFGASSSFSQIHEQGKEALESQKKISLLEWD